MNSTLVIKLKEPDCLYTAVYNELRGKDYKWNTQTGELIFDDIETYTLAKQKFDEMENFKKQEFVPKPAKPANKKGLKRLI